MMITSGKETINVSDVDTFQGVQRFASVDRRNSIESVTTEGTSELPVISNLTSPRQGLTEVNSVVSSRNHLSVAEFIKANKASGRYNNEEFEYILPGTVAIDDLNSGGKITNKSRKISYLEQNGNNNSYKLPQITFSSPRNWNDGHLQLGKIRLGKKQSFLG